VSIVGVAAPAIGLEEGPEEAAVVEQIAAARPHLVLAFLGAPKGELWIDRVRDRIRPAVALQLGATLEFFLGRVRRAPRWMQNAGLEWLYRLLHEPLRLARRYLVQDAWFLVVLAQTLLTRRSQRLRLAGRDEADAIQRAASSDR
jgi:N-acetylglucosaminyldiphosphoundecaprenol N-acetyl-beta-D-mannosaminyltransferase